MKTCFRSIDDFTKGRKCYCIPFWYRFYLTDLHGHPRHKYLRLYAADEKLVSMINYTINGMIDIHDLITTEKYRGRGIASKLLDIAENSDERPARIFINGDLTLKNFYTKRGYVLTGQPWAANKYYSEMIKPASESATRMSSERGQSSLSVLNDR